LVFRQAAHFIVIFSDMRGENHSLQHFLTVPERNKKML